MVRIVIDGEEYLFDNYDDAAVTKDILEDILKSSWLDQRIKTIRVVNAIKDVLEANGFHHI